MPKSLIAVAVAIGYVLGRTRKMKLAIAVAGIVAGRRLKLDPQALLEQGSKLVASSPELHKLTGEVKDKVTHELARRLLEAATSAATNRVDAWADKIRGVGDAADTAQSVGQDTAEKATGTLQDTTTTTGQTSSSVSTDESRSAEDTDEAGDEDAEREPTEQDESEGEAAESSDGDEAAGQEEVPTQRQTKRASRAPAAPRRPRAPKSRARASETE